MIEKQQCNRHIDARWLAVAVMLLMLWLNTNGTRAQPALQITPASVSPSQPPFYLSSIVVWPPDPTTADSITILVRGEWTNACVPYYTGHSIVEHSIWIEASANYPPGTFCAMVITGWEFAVPIGTLPVGEYTVWATLDGYLSGVTVFQVTPATPTPTVTNSPTVTPTPTETLTPTPVPTPTCDAGRGLCDGRLTVRAFSSFQCRNRDFNDSVDRSVGGAEITLGYSNGARVVRQTNTHGLTSFLMNLPADTAVTVSVEWPAVPDRHLTSCPGSPASVQLRAADFQDSIVPRRYVTFRAQLVD